MSAANNVRKLVPGTPATSTTPAVKLPASPEVEAAFLYAILTAELRTPEVSAALCALKPEHMFTPANARILQAMQAFPDASKLDAITVSDHLRNIPSPPEGWLRYLTVTLAAEGVHGDVPPSEYAEIILEKWRLRETIRVAEGMIVRAQEHEPSEALGAQARDALTDLGQTHTSAGLPAATTHEVATDVWTMITDAAGGKAIGVSWGFDVLDERVGRIQQPSYVVIGGRSGQGKTQLAWQTGINMGGRPKDPATGMRESLYIASFESKRELLVFRGICTEANVSPKLVTSGKIPVERDPRLDGAVCPACDSHYKYETWDNLPTNSRGERVCRVCAARERSVEVAPVPEAQQSPFERLTAAASMIAAIPMFIDDKPCPPRELAERFKRIRDLAAEGKMKSKVVGSAKEYAYPPSIMRTCAVDSIQDMPPPPGSAQRNRTTEIQDTSKGLMRDVANALGIAVIGLAKLTREVDKQPNKRPHLKDIRECGDIEYHADEIFFIHREQYYLRENTPPEWRNIAEIIHGKGRMGLDLEAPPARLWFSGGMFFPDPPAGWASWEVDHGGKS